MIIVRHVAKYTWLKKNKMVKKNNSVVQNSRILQGLNNTKILE